MRGWAVETLHSNPALLPSETNQNLVEMNCPREAFDGVDGRDGKTATPVPRSLNRSHSRLRVSAGSCSEARRAGIAIANSAGTKSSKAEPTRTEVEVECTP